MDGKNKKSESVYGAGPGGYEEAKSHTLSILVANEPGVTARIAGLFSGRGYNIESFTGAETDHDKHLSRINIVCSGTAMVIEQIKAQIRKLIPVRSLVDLTLEGSYVARELALLKICGSEETRVQALRIAEASQAKIVDSSPEFVIFEVTGMVEDIDAFIELMRPLGLEEASRTGVAAIARGKPET